MQAPAQNWFLRFRVPSIERAFRQYQAEDARPYVFWGMLTAIIGWVSLMVLIPLLRLSLMARFAPVFAVVIFLLAIAMVASNYERATPYIFWFVAAANIAGGSGLVYAGHVLLGE